MGLDFRSELHPRFQRIEWLVERIAWLLLAALLIAAILGVFGHGLLSSRSVSERQGNSEVKLTVL
jgi:hypothetical protein